MILPALKPQSGLVLLLALSLFSSRALCEESEAGNPSVEVATGEDWTQKFAVFLGASTQFEEGEDAVTGMTIGLEYEYRFAEDWGVAGVVETVLFTEDHRDLALVVPVIWHATEALEFAVGPGLEFEEGETEWLVRFAVSYEFEFDPYYISPAIGIDVSESAETVLYGIVLGRKF